MVDETLADNKPAQHPFSFTEAVLQGVTAIRSHPMRAGLAGVAIAAAVATIATVVVALDGVERFARDNASRAFGADTFVVAKIAAPGQISRTELEAKLERNPDIKRNDLRFLERFADGRALYGATVSQRGQVAAGSLKYDGALILGATSTMNQIRDLTIDRGRFFLPEEENSAQQVALIGATIAEELFPGRDALGQSVRVAGRGFRVIGIQRPQGSVGGASLDRNVWIPLQTYERIYGGAESLQITARAPDSATRAWATSDAEDRARVTLRARHQLRPGEEDDFDVLSPDAARSFVQAISQRIGVAAAPISAMALLAAIVVVANTILVAVTQRTLEIGVRRAVGASRRQILAEILAESVTIACLGGVAGLAVTFGLLQLLGGLGLDLQLTLPTMLGSLAAAAASGLIAGWIPARRATRINVVDALRAE